MEELVKATAVNSASDEETEEDHDLHNGIKISSATDSSEAINGVSLIEDEEIGNIKKHKNEDSGNETDEANS